LPARGNSHDTRDFLCQRTSGIKRRGHIFNGFKGTPTLKGLPSPLASHPSKLPRFFSSLFPLKFRSLAFCEPPPKRERTTNRLALSLVKVGCFTPTPIFFLSTFAFLVEVRRCPPPLFVDTELGVRLPFLLFFSSPTSFQTAVVSYFSNQVFFPPFHAIDVWTSGPEDPFFCRSETQADMSLVGGPGCLSLTFF